MTEAGIGSHAGSGVKFNVGAAQLTLAAWSSNSPQAACCRVPTEQFSTEDVADIGPTAASKHNQAVGKTSTVLASACCLGPLVLITLGISGAWIGNLAALEPYRPWFIGAALVAMVFAWRRI